MSSGNEEQIVLRRLTRADAAVYRAFRQAQLSATPTAFTSTAAEERLKSVSWAADRIQHPEHPLDFILGAFDAAGRLVGMAGLTVPPQHQARHKGTLVGMAVAGEVAGRGGRTRIGRASARGGETRRPPPGSADGFRGEWARRAPLSLVRLRHVRP